MIEDICDFLINKMKKEQIDMTKEEEIKYGLELMIGEFPKIILLILIAFLLNIGWFVIFAYITMLPYKIFAGGFHLKTNLGCILCTSTVYYGNVFLSKYLQLNQDFKNILILAIWIISMILITMYAPADTENLPILRKKERKIKRIISYIVMTITLISAIYIKDNTLSNILILNVIIESLSITKIAYKITNNKYGYEAYNN